MNDFQILGIAPGSDDETIKKAWRKLAKKFHTDRLPNSKEAHDRIASINAAHDRIVAGKPNMGDRDQKGRPPKQADIKTQPFRGFEDLRKSSTVTRPPRPHPFSHQRPSPQSASAPLAPDDASNDPVRSAMKGKQVHLEPNAADTDQRREERIAAARANAVQKFTREHSVPSVEVQDQRMRAPIDARVMQADIDVSAAGKDAMRDALERRMRQEAFRRVTELRGHYADPRQAVDTNRGDLPGFHMADHIAFKGRKVQIHVLEMAKDGRNIVAMPDLMMVDQNTVRQGNSVHLYEIIGKDGRQSQKLDASYNPIKGAMAVDVEFVFGSDRCRTKTRSQADEQR
ncbi:J domain-containing protein [Loktanella sp. DJP18]|uniref:J domain-containing protein n=1 Tax=Loktanella sp. DJP18 TaxID=3409788 RepID=UPI003BB56B8E